MSLNKTVIDGRINILESIPNNMSKVAILIHGFGESKERISDHLDVLNKNGIGIIGFDLPCHGEDSSNDHDFKLSTSIDYLNKVIYYSKKYNVPIILIGTSFGGYVLLNRINNVNEHFYKVFLKYPAVNFYDITKSKLGVDIDYFNNHEYYEFQNGKKMYYETVLEFKNSDIMEYFNKHNNDLFIIHGDKDETVYLHDIEYFSKKNNIKLYVVNGAPHGMKNYMDIVNDKLINFINGDINEERK